MLPSGSKYKSLVEFSLTCLDDQEKFNQPPILHLCVSVVNSAFWVLITERLTGTLALHRNGLTKHAFTMCFLCNRQDFKERLTTEARRHRVSESGGGLSNLIWLTPISSLTKYLCFGGRVGGRKKYKALSSPSQPCSLPAPIMVIG